MSTMVERVARALSVSKGLNPDCLHQFNVFSGNEQFDHEDDRGKRYRLGWRLQEHHARAAIEAMLEPTEAMQIAGCQYEHLGDIAGRYNAMIQAALKEQA